MEQTHILDFKINVDFHPNGNLSYADSIVILKPEFADKYPYRISHPDGYDFIRERQVKFHSNGQLNWELNYDRNGKCIKDNKPSFRADGTVIVYSSI